MSDVFYKRNLAVPFFTQRDNTYVWQFLAKCQKLKSYNQKLWIGKNSLR